MAWLAALLFLLPAGAGAQDFGVMESAETINQRNFKLTVNPMFVFGDGTNETGVALKAGYGFTPNFDMEGKVAIYDGLTFFGADFEYWLVKNRPWDVSVGAGFHFGRGDFALDTTGVDLTLIASRRVAEKLDFYGALDLAFNSVKDDVFDERFTQAHFVPGIEYAISSDLDFLAEIGLGLNDDASNYVSVGLAYYLR
jgi:hypothetical protein